MTKVQIITAGKHDGLSMTLEVLPRAGDSFELDGVDYRVFRVLHKIESPIIRGSDEFTQRLALVLERV